MSLTQFKLLRPRTVDEAFEFLAKHASNLRVLAGGTDLIPSMRQKLFEPEYVLDIRHIADLKGIRPRLRTVSTIGALTHADARSSILPFLKQNYPVLTGSRGDRGLSRAAQYGHDRRQYLSRHAMPLVQPVAHMAQRMRLLHQERWRPVPRCARWKQMLGGLFRRHASGAAVLAMPRSKSPVLSGARRLPLREFYTGLGDDYRKLAERTKSSPASSCPQSSAGYRGVYRKLRIRGSIDYPLAGVAVAMKRSNGHIEDATVALTAVNPAPVLVKGATALLNGKVISERSWPKRLAIWPHVPPSRLTTSALTPEYRREMIRVFTKRAVLAAGSN